MLLLLVDYTTERDVLERVTFGVLQWLSLVRPDVPSFTVLHAMRVTRTMASVNAGLQQNSVRTDDDGAVSSPYCATRSSACVAR